MRLAITMYWQATGRAPKTPAVHSWEIAWMYSAVPIRETKVSLIRGLRPMKTGRDKSVCKQPICP